jgi:hypothetical protein
MSFHFSLKIVTDGLVLYLDGANPKSYVSGSTIWNDISKNSNNGTLTNGPTFDTSNRGCIIFDGVNDYVGVNNFIGNLNTFSVNHFIYLNTSQNGKTIFSNFGNDNNGWVTGISDSQTNVIKFYLGNIVHLYSNTVLQNLIWYSITITYNNGNPKIYINGVEDNSSSTVLTPSSSYFGNDIGRLGDGSQHFNGGISNIQVYNRALTPSEVLQNYNSLKGRFGL